MGTREAAERSHSLKRHREEPAERPQKRRRTFSPIYETADPKSTSPSYYSDISQWALSVARDTAEAKGQTEDQQDYLSKMRRFFPVSKLQRKRSSASIASDLQTDEGGSSPSTASNLQTDQGYYDVRYTAKLKANGAYMTGYRGKLPDAEKFNNELRLMLEKEQPEPKYSLFSDDYFEDTMDMIQDRNEAFIIETIGQLMFPHVQARTICGEKRFAPFIQSFNEGWNNCKKITQTRPQPDSAIGFSTTAFSDEQLEKLQPYLGNLDSLSDFRATFYMYFPFLTCEVKRGNAGLDIADRQNAHSMAVAVRGLAALFRIVGREQEIHGKILTISFSFDYRGVRVYGYRPIIKDEETEVWREDIDVFDFKTGNGRNKWKCLQYSLNALEIGLHLLDRIRSVIDDWVPDHELAALQASETSHPIRVPK